MNDEIKTTEFNSSLESLKRLNNELILCNQYSKMARVEKDESSLGYWMASIIAAYKEVDPKMTNEERMVYNNKWHNFKKKNPAKLFEEINQEGKRIKVMSHIGLNQRIAFFDSLELYIRRLATTKGMLIIDKLGMDETPEEW